MGWTCRDVTTRRREGEDEEALWQRHDDEVSRAYGVDAMTMSVQLIE